MHFHVTFKFKITQLPSGKWQIPSNVVGGKVLLLYPGAFQKNLTNCNCTYDKKCTNIRDDNMQENQFWERGRGGSHVHMIYG